MRSLIVYVLSPFAIWGEWLEYTYVATANLTPPTKP